MNKEEATSCSLPAGVGSSGDPSKLLSLLALAAGAASMPQTSNADIVVTDLSIPVTVVGNTNSSFLIDNLPGISGGRAIFGFQGDAIPARPATSHSGRRTNRSSPHASWTHALGSRRSTGSSSGPVYAKPVRSPN